MDIKRNLHTCLVVLWVSCAQAQAGDTWTAAGQGLTTPSVGSLAVGSDGALYAGTNGGGVFKSVDKGGTWTPANQGLTNKTVKALAVAADGMLYTGTDRGVFKSADQGATWVASGPSYYDSSFGSLAVATDGTLYAGSFSNGIYKSLDKGVTLAGASHGLAWIDTNYDIVNSLAVAADGTVYAGTSFGGIYKSMDQGSAWTASNQGLTSKFVWSVAIAADGTLYAGTNGGGVFKSADKGVTWTTSNQGLTSKDVRVVALSGNDTVYAGTYDGGVFRSVDKGATWTSVASGLTNLWIRSLAVAGDGSVYAGTSSGVQRLSGDVAANSSGGIYLCDLSSNGAAIGSTYIVISLTAGAKAVITIPAVSSTPTYYGKIVGTVSGDSFLSGTGTSAWIGTMGATRFTVASGSTSGVCPLVFDARAPAGAPQAGSYTCNLTSNSVPIGSYEMVITINSASQMVVTNPATTPYPHYFGYVIGTLAGNIYTGTNSGGQPWNGVFNGSGFTFTSDSTRGSCQPSVD